MDGFEAIGTEQEFWDSDYDKTNRLNEENVKNFRSKVQSTVRDALGDSRTLYERLEEQRRKKQDDLDDKHSITNYVQESLDSDSYQFLKSIESKKVEEERKAMEEEEQAIQRIREKQLRKRPAPKDDEQEDPDDPVLPFLTAPPKSANHDAKPTISIKKRLKLAVKPSQPSKKQ